jgi:hypothetical protein
VLDGLATLIQTAKYALCATLTTLILSGPIERELPMSKLLPKSTKGTIQAIESYELA